MSMVLIGSKVNSKSHSELTKALYSTENKEFTKSVIEDCQMNYKHFNVHRKLIWNLQSSSKLIEVRQN